MNMAMITVLGPDSSAKGGQRNMARRADFSGSRAHKPPRRLSLERNPVIPLTTMHGKGRHVGAGACVGACTSCSTAGGATSTLTGRRHSSRCRTRKQRAQEDSLTARRGRSPEGSPELRRGRLRIPVEARRSGRTRRNRTAGTWASRFGPSCVRSGSRTSASTTSGTPGRPVC